MSTSYVFPFQGVTTVPVDQANDLFPVRRIFCVGRNYADHAMEMGHEPEREVPMFFTKPSDAVLVEGTPIPYPGETQNLHHEIELVVALGKGGSCIAEGDAYDCVFGYGVGLDLTRRDIQAAAKEKGYPWDCAKAFDYSAPMGVIYPAARIGHPTKGRIWLEVNRQVRQAGNIEDMIWNIPEIIAWLSKYFELAPGDLIFTGTPAGVSALERGDSVQGGIEGIGNISFTVS